MDFSQQPTANLQEIEKQVSPDGLEGPKMLSQSIEKDRSVLINLLAALGISVVSTAAVILLLAIPFSGKKVAVKPTVTNSTLSLGSSNIVVQTEYVNPFSTTAQYVNPFIATKNPFAAFASQ